MVAIMTGASNYKLLHNYFIVTIRMWTVNHYLYMELLFFYLPVMFCIFTIIVKFCDSKLFQRIEKDIYIYIFILTNINSKLLVLSK